MRTHLCLCLLLLSITTVAAAQSSPVSVEPVGAIRCKLETVKYCKDYDAIVFVHGIYGDRDTFTNSTTNFDWPAAFPRKLNGRNIDVYRLNYQTALVSWARDSNPDFSVVAEGFVKTLEPMRKRQYRSIGFIAHSLGGNLISTYIHLVTTRYLLPVRSQHAFVITLGTPVMGAQIANIAGTIKAALGMSDPLLESLRSENLYLDMLNEFRKSEMYARDHSRYDCRYLNLHAAVEQKEMFLFKVVGPGSAMNPIQEIVASPIRGFALDHSQIARPDSLKHEVAKWVMELVRQEYTRLGTWSLGNDPARPTLCKRVPFLPE